MKKRFCVIGQYVNTTVPRTWTEDIEEASQHAKNLIAGKKCTSCNDTLLVVEVRRVVRLASPPIEIVDASEIL